MGGCILGASEVGILLGWVFGWLIKVIIGVGAVEIVSRRGVGAGNLAMGRNRGMGGAEICGATRGAEIELRCE